MVKLSQILENPNALRRTVNEGVVNELVTSIKELGVKYPILVRKLPKKWWQFQKYMLVDGLHRLHAMKHLSFKKCLVQVVSITDKEKLILSIIESKTHVQPSKEQYRRALKKILETNQNMTVAELANRIGKSEAWVRLYLRKDENDPGTDAVN